MALYVDELIGQVMGKPALHTLKIKLRVSKDTAHADWHLYFHYQECKIQKRVTDCFVSDLVGVHKDWFPCDEAELDEIILSFAHCQGVRLINKMDWRHIIQVAFTIL